MFQSKINVNQSKKVNLGVTLLSLSCLLSVLTSLRVEIFRDWNGNNFVEPSTSRMDITSFERRFAPLRAVLPSHAVVGYVSDSRSRPPFTPKMEFRLVQYTLIPVIVVDGPNHAYVVGNFHSSVPDPRSPEMQNLVLLKDFGDGVMLFRDSAE